MKFMKYVLLIFLALNAINARAHAAAFRKGQNPSQAILAGNHPQTGQSPISNPETPPSKQKGLLNRLKHATGFSSPAGEKRESERQNQHDSSQTTKKSDKKPRPGSFSGYGSASSPARNKSDRKSRFSMFFSKSARQNTIQPATGNARRSSSRPSLTPSKSMPAPSVTPQSNIAAPPQQKPKPTKEALQQKLDKAEKKHTANQEALKQAKAKYTDAKKATEGMNRATMSAQDQRQILLNEHNALNEVVSATAKVTESQRKVKAINADLKKMDTSVAERKSEKTAEKTSVLNSKDTLSNLEQKMRDWQNNPQDEQTKAAYFRAKKMHEDTVAAEKAELFAKMQSDTTPSAKPLPASVQPSIITPPSNPSGAITPSIMNPAHATAPTVAGAPLPSHMQAPWQGQGIWHQGGTNQPHLAPSIASGTQQQAHQQVNPQQPFGASVGSTQLPSHMQAPWQGQGIWYQGGTNQPHLAPSIAGGTQQQAHQQANPQQPFAASVGGAQLPSRPQDPYAHQQDQQYPQNFPQSPQQHAWQRQYEQKNAGIIATANQNRNPLDPWTPAPGTSGNLQVTQNKDTVVPPGGSPPPGFVIKESPQPASQPPAISAVSPEPTVGQVPRGGTPPPGFLRQQQAKADQAEMPLEEFQKLTPTAQQNLMNEIKKVNQGPTQQEEKRGVLPQEIKAYMTEAPKSTEQTLPGPNAAQPKEQAPVPTTSSPAPAQTSSEDFEDMMRARYANQPKTYGK